jgi:thiosulfate dehydrogenase (quinone) large subunit
MNRTQEQRDRTIAYALLRVFLGVNIALHGIARLLGPTSFQSKIESQFAHAPLPHPLVAAFAFVLPWAEAIFGLLILAGFWTRFALIAGAILMIVLTFGTCLIQDWPTAGTQLVYMAVYMLLIFLLNYNRWSADALLHQGRHSR